MDMQEYLRNRRQFPHDALEKYAGQHVAWSPDGTRIIASAEDVLRLVEAITALGFDSAEVVIEPIPYPDEIVLGAGLDS
ncbi:MAG: hypothetical protein HUU20_14120 [Pirellulales bacterium]|nr:hypothetical protein [Pirellulales bacterium]